MPLKEHEKLGVHAPLLSDSLVGVPFKKRRFLFTRSPSPPPQLPPSSTDNCDVQCKSESSEFGSTVSETCGHPVQADVVTGNKSPGTGKQVSLNPGEGPKTRDVSVSPKHDTLLVSSGPGLGPYVEANSNATNTEQEMVLNNELLAVKGSSQMQETLEVPKKVSSNGDIIVKSGGTSALNDKMLPVMENTQLESVMQETLELAQKVEKDDGQMLVCSQEISLRENRSSDTDLRVDSSHLSRSNWDLNTTMDAWESSNTNITIHGFNQSTVTSEHLKGLDLSLNQNLYGGPSDANLMSGSCNLQTNGNDLSLLNQSTVMTEHSNSETCLDLQLKPSSSSNTYPTSSNYNASSEMSFLSLSVKPTTMISSHNPQLATNRVEKSEPYESCRDTVNADKMHNPNSQVLKHLKSEPCEGTETSKTIPSVDLKSICSIAIKQETLESLGSHRSPEGKSFPINLGGHGLSPQSTGIAHCADNFDGNSPQSTGITQSAANFGGNSSDPTCKFPQCTSPEGKMLQMDLGGHDSSMQNTELNQNFLKVDGNILESACKPLKSDDIKLHSFGAREISRDTVNADKMHNPNSQVLKHMKSEPCEGPETSKAIVSGDLKSICGIAIKQEALDQSQGSHRSPEGKSFPINVGGHGLSPQSTGITQSAVNFGGNSPYQTCKSPQCKSPEGNMLLGGHDSSMQNTELNPNFLKVDGNTLESICKPLKSDDRKLHSDTEDPSRHISQDYTIVDKVQDINLASSCLPPDTAMPNAVEDAIRRPIISDGNELNSVKGLCEADNLSLLPECLASERNKHIASVVADSIAQVYSSDACTSSEITQIDERVSDQYEKEKVQSNKIMDKPDTSPVTLEKNCEYESKVNISHDAAGGINTRRKERGTVDKDYEDGEVRDRGLNTAVEGSREKTMENVEEQLKDIIHQTSTLVQLSVLETSFAEEKGISMHTMSDTKGHDTIVPEVGVCDNKDGQGSSSQPFVRISPKNQPSKAVRKISAIKKHKGPLGNTKSDASHNINTVIKSDQVDVGNQQEKPEGMLCETSELCRPESSQVDGANQPSKAVRNISAIKKHKGPLGNTKYDASHNINTIIKSDQVDVGNQQEKPEDMLSEASELCKPETSQADGATKDVSGTGQHSRIIYLNSTSNKSVSEKVKSKSSRPSSSLIERGIPVDRFIWERDDSHASRDEHSKFEVERVHFHQSGRRVTDLMQNRGRNDERRSGLRATTNSDSDQLSKHINSLTGVQYQQGLNDPEIANDASSNGCSRNIRKQANHNFQNVSRIPNSGRSPGLRGHVMMVRHPIRDISPRGCIGREVPDFILAHEENLVRNLPNVMMEPPIPSRPRSQYDRSDNMLIRRERRSLSPTQQRRGGVMHLPVDCTKTSSRAQQSSPHQWTTPERCPESYYVHPRSPEMVRLDRMRPQHQRPCYQDEMVIRRRASPQYSDEVSDDGMNMVAHARELDFQRRGRGFDRNMRRFNLLDPREIAEEKYFRPPLPHSQIREFAEEDGYGDDRPLSHIQIREFAEEDGYGDARGPMRFFRQRCVSDDDGEDFRFRVESGPSRPFRLRPGDNEGFPEGESPRDFNGRLRNRLDNRCDRSRGVVQEQDINYRHNEGQVWHDAGYGDVRIKKRRF